MHFCRTSAAALCLSVMLVSMSASHALSAGPIFWDWPRAESFTDMQWENAGVDADGRLIAGPEGHDIGLEGAEVSWTVISDGDEGFFVGTGHGGKIYHVDRHHEVRLYASLEVGEVFSLLLMPDGELLAGGAPEGHLYRIDPQGRFKQLGTVPGGYIWAMEEVGQEVFLACGSPAAVYRLDANNHLTPAAELPAQNALDLLATDDGRLLVGTQGPGLVFRWDPSASQAPWALCEVEQDEVRQLLHGPAGDVYLLALASQEESAVPESMAPGVQPRLPEMMRPMPGLLEAGPDKSALYKLADDGRCDRFWSGQLEVMTVAYSERWGWLAGGTLEDTETESRLYGLEAFGGHHEVARWTGGDILAIADLSGGDLAVAQTRPGGVRVLAARGREAAVAMSPALDAGRPVQWGRLRHRAQGKVRFAVRGGNRSLPDGSWTDWSPWFAGDDEAIHQPRTRFLQWKAELPRGKMGKEVPGVTKVSVSALPQNAAPAIQRLTIENITAVSIGGLHEGSENVTQKLENGLRVEFGRKSQINRQAGLDRSAFTRPVRVLTWQGLDPDEDRLVYTLEYRRAEGGVWRTIVEETQEALGSWDTSNVPDGEYELRLTVSDHKDNPLGAGLKASRGVGPVTVDNTAPMLDAWRVEPVPGGARLRFTVEDRRNALAEAWLILPNNERSPLRPQDGICDSRKESFDTVVPQQGEASPWIFQVEVWDLAGNVARQDGVLE